MYYAIGKIKEHVKVVEAQIKSLKEDNFEETKSRIIVRVIDAVYNFLEICEGVSTNSPLARYGKRLLMPIVNDIRRSEEIENLKTSTNQFLAFIQENENDFENFSGMIAGICDEEFLDFEHYIAPRRAPFNVLFYDCSRAAHRGKIKSADYKSTYNTYGIYAERTPDYSSNVDNIACGIGVNSRFTNNAFDILVYMPNYTAVARFTGPNQNIIEQYELAKLRIINRYLRHDGLLQVVIPYCRIDHQLAFYLAKNFKDIQVLKLNNRFCEISGIKSSNDEINRAGYDLVLNYYLSLEKTSDNEKQLKDHGPYKLPHDLLSIDMFRGSKITDEALKGVLSRSTCLSTINESDYEKTTTHHPLLPFNTGQIGLILASGCLDGIIDEDETHCHLIKGRVYQREMRRHEEDKIIVNRFNQVQINALTPDGTFITIR